MITRALLVAWLTLVWVLLWGEPSVGNVVAGVLLGILVVAAFPPGDEQGRGVHPLAVLSFGWWFAKALVIANLQVAAQIIRPRLRLEEGIVAVPLRCSSPVVATVVARDGHAIDADALIEHCRARLAPWEVPKAITVADALPRTAAGKLLRRAL